MRGFVRRRPVFRVVLAAAALSIIAGITAVGMDRGYPAQQVRLLSGAAWLPSSQVGQVTLLDGSSAEVAAQLKVAPAGNTLDVVQNGSTAYAVDRTAGTVRRVDGATFELTSPEAPIRDARSGLTAYAGKDTLYTLDTERGLLTATDPRTLGALGQPLSLAAKLGTGSAAVDDAGRLWIIDSASGDLTSIAQGRRDIHRNTAKPGRSELVMTGGGPVVVDYTDRKAILIDPDSGQARNTIMLDVHPDDKVAVSGSPHGQRLYLVASRGLLAICELSKSACDSVVPLDAANGELGAAVEAGDRLFIPDYSTGQVWVIDLARHTVLARPKVLTPPAQFQLLTRDGIVFYNDPTSERAGVIRLDGGFVPVAKYDPKDPDKGLNAPVTTEPSPAPAQPQPNQPSSPTQSPPPRQPPVSNQPPTNQPAHPPSVSRPPTNQPGPTNQPSPTASSPKTTVTTTTSTTTTSTSTTSPTTTPPPDLRITLSKANPIVKEDVTLQVSNSNGPDPSSATWDFGDSEQANGTIVTHNWATARTYQVTVQATMPDNQRASKSVSIQVSPIPTVTLTVTAPINGSVAGAGIACPATCTATINKGQTVTLTATPAANHTFAGWGGACTGTGNCTLTMDADKTLTATFRSAIEPFVGTWANIDPNTRNIPQVQIVETSPTTATLHVWGMCHPTWCDWGTTTATLANGQLNAFYDQGFATQTLRMSLSNGQLIIQDHCDFIPPDTRTDYDVTDTMRKT